MTYDIEDVSKKDIELVTDKMKCCQFFVRNDDDGEIRDAAMSFHAYPVYQAMRIDDS
jgi:predicted aldo/keto reductase-like oxidoreductase